MGSICGKLSKSTKQLHLLAQGQQSFEELVSKIQKWAPTRWLNRGDTVKDINNSANRIHFISGQLANSDADDKMTADESAAAIAATTEYGKGDTTAGTLSSSHQANRLLSFTDIHNKLSNFAYLAGLHFVGVYYPRIRVK